MPINTKLAVVSRDHIEYQAMIKKSEIQGFELFYSGGKESIEVLEHAEVILSEPDLAASFVTRCKKLSWLQSTWAGNNKLQACDFKNYTLTGVKGIFAEQMKNYVFAYILYFARRVPEFIQAQNARIWDKIYCPPLSGKTLGILGLGNIGKELATLAHAFGMNVVALNSSGKNYKNVICYSASKKSELASVADFVVNILPETEQTIGLINKEFIKAMKSDAILINAGRGSVIDCDSTIIEALQNGMLKAVVLDVFDKEPLAEDHPFYQTKNLFITNHSAAISEPAAVFNVFKENCIRYQKGTALMYQHNFSKGY